ncbi:MAG TPA: GAF domain-containing protein [Rhizomicrobium sp.]|jgi:GAF domain-containing protein
MYTSVVVEATDKPEFYRQAARQLEALLEGERDPIANAANTAALLFDLLADVNWAGFYFLRERNELVLGPFQGKPACVRIRVGRGVCGAAALRRQSIVVDDVQAFPDHIACDTASRSELVVPLVSGSELIGVLDIDSPTVSRFEADDRSGVEKLAAIYITASDFKPTAAKP